MFFGLTNSLATFQALMNLIFADLIAKGVVAVYLDNILILLQPESPDWSPDMPISRAQERSRTNSEVRSPTQKC
jgi:hypothetical protein